MDYWIWRGCERFGIDPREIQKADPAFVARLVMYAMLRDQMPVRL